MLKLDKTGQYNNDNSAKHSKVFTRILYFLFSVPFIVFILTELRFDVNMPNWDDYDSVLNWLSNWISDKSLLSRIDLLFRQHNEHRIVWDRIIEILELYLVGNVNFVYLDFFGAGGLFLFVAAIALMAKEAGLGLPCLIPISFFMLTFAQYNLVSFSMASIQVYWSLLFSAISFYFVSKNSSKNSFINGFIFSTFSSFTSAGGLIGFPAVLLYCVLTKKYFFASFWAIGSAIIFLVYFIYFPYHQTTIGIASHRYAYSHLWQYIKYILLFLGNISPWRGFSIFLGTILLCVSVYIILLARIPEKDWIIITLIFLLATAAAAGLSRIGLSTTQALSSRYTIFGATLLTVNYISVSASLRGSRFSYRIGASIAILFYTMWFRPGLESMSTTKMLMTNSLRYPVQSEAYSILKKAMDQNIFLPLYSIYRNLPNAMPIKTRSLYHAGYLGKIDSINVSGGLLKIRGWAALPPRDMPAAAVIVKLDHKYYPTVYGLSRPDVMNHFQNKNYRYTGFESTIAVPKSANGICILSLVAVGPDRVSFYQSPTKTYSCH